MRLIPNKYLANSLKDLPWNSIKTCAIETTNTKGRIFGLKKIEIANNIDPK